jgi:hypothetical protein
MNNNKKKKLSISNLCLGYVLGITFIWLMLINIDERGSNEANVVSSREQLDPEVIEVNRTIIEEKTVYVDRFINKPIPSVEYIDRLDGVIIDGDKEVAIVHGGSDLIVKDDIVYNNRHTERTDETTRSVIRNERSGVIHNRINNYRHNNGSHADVDGRSLLRDKEYELSEERLITYEEALKKDQIGINKKSDDLDFSKLTVSEDENEFELGDIDSSFGKEGEGYGTGKGGQLYAYNFPSKGIGAGVGSGGLGAAGGSGAGLGAGIGEGLLNGESVPTLGGIGDGAKSEYGEPAESAGVGGLLGGAGAGGAAGLTQGYITEKLGLGAGPGVGAGGNGGYGRNYDHLPKDGALHIMMHVDGSGSILNTRKQLDIMKNTLLKEALLPYYKNDESLYNNRVSIIANSGERTLKFFSKAAERENVLAIAFQDEAQPSYHLPNFNKKPEDDYLDDLKVLKSKLNSHDGVYRGIMFQVDRGKTFAKSFKEFVGNAFQGKGYLKNKNLKQYYWQDNASSIKQKRGIVFSDEYHAKDEGDPQYYMNLIFDAAKKVGIDLNTHGAGLTDGKKTNK